MKYKDKEYRQIRIFLSSTFKDMQEERDALVKLFRQLAVEGRKHHISITLLDLRWGITDDQKKNGMVISICLQEIDNSRPFFIGLIGKRYGWVPSGEELNSADLFVKFPRLKYYADKGMSITEIEMRYGALDSDANIHSIFLCKQGIKPESPNHQNLIKDIDKSENTNLFTYSSIPSLVDTVREQFLKMMDESLEEELKDSQEKILDIQERVLYQKSEGYVKVGDYKDQLDEWVGNDQPVVTITGESGSGKTSLIASWVKENAYMFDKTIYYFIGEEDASSQPIDIQKFIIKEIEKYYGIDLELDKVQAQWDEALPEDFGLEMEKALKEVGKREESLLLVLDGLNYIDNQGINKLLIWLPEIPQGVKMILSTVPQDLTYNSIVETKNYTLIEMGELKQSELMEIAKTYLARFGKSLDPKLFRMIADNKIYKKNSILKILLDDLISYGVHEELPVQIEKYAKSKDVEDFFDRIVERAETFYGKQKIKHLLLLLLISKKGLEEADIQDILRLTPLEWSEIYCGLINYLIFTNGKYTLRYPELSAAIEYRYSKTKKEEIDTLRRNIILTLGNRENEEDEIAFQAFQLNDYNLLYATLEPFEVMADLIVREERLFFQYWKELQKQGFSFSNYLDNMPMDKEYLEEKIPFLAHVVDLELNNLELATAFIEKYTLLLSSSNENKEELSDLYIFLANLNAKYNNFEISEDYLKKAKSLLNSLPDLPEWKYSEYYFVKGTNLYKQQNFEKALETINLSLSLSKKNEYYDEIDDWKSLNLRGLVLLGMKCYEEAIESFEKALELTTSFLTSKLLEPSLIINNIGYCYLEMGEYDIAEEYLNKAIDQYIDIFGNPNLEFYLPVSNLITVNIRKKNYEEAKENLEFLLKILDESDQAYIYQYLWIYKNLGEVEMALGNSRKAKKWMKKAEKLSKESYN